MTVVNRAQSDFWNGEMAARWISRDAVQERAFAPVTRALLDAAGIAPGDRVLDVGCGTGGVSIAAAASGASVLGLDISAPMLDHARAKAADAGQGDLRFEVWDAQTFDPGRARFDRMISRFGMMFFQDPVAAFANIARALRSGGTMTFVCWGDPPANPWFALPRRLAEARLGPLPAADPHGPGPFGFADAPWVLSLMRDAGLGTAAHRVVELDLTPGDTVEEVLETAALGPIAGAMRDLGGTAEDLAAITEAFRTALADFLTPQGVRMPARLNLFSACV